MTKIHHIEKNVVAFVFAINALQIATAVIVCGDVIPRVVEESRSLKTPHLSRSFRFGRDDT